MLTHTRHGLTLMLLTTAIALTACGGSSKKDKKKTEVVPKKDINQELPITPEPSVANKLQTELKKYPHSPSLTIVMVPKEDVQTSIKALKEKGGQLVYDPNQGFGSDIPFFIATLTAEQINDSKFIGALKLKAATIDQKIEAIKPVEFDKALQNPSTFIPVNSVKLEALLSGGQEQSELGKDITVAVIDSGIDASHPAFNGRVDYWYDATEETKTLLQKTELKDGAISIQVGSRSLSVKMPENAPEGEVSYAVIDEKLYLSQLNEETQTAKGFKDINNNGIADQFLIVGIHNDKGQHFLIDSNASLSFDHESENNVKIDYNATKQNNRLKGMVEFPSRNNVIQYPILFTQEGDKSFVGLGIPDGRHGTHVAGIIASNYPEANLLGAAPSARLLSLRVCSEISCTDSAIIKGLYQAFYNGKYIPDVVNISLGTHEGEVRDVYSHVFNDLSAKFGTIFFISASNSGPGFRTLNLFGNSGAVVMVGANVSKQTLIDQYNLPESENLPEETLLYFSSLGPSYTSEMKPNIVAPGAAISSVLFQTDAIGQANGTSMSSPLAAGTMAAVLGKIKSENPEALNKVKTLRGIHQRGTQKAEGSLLPYVYAMRDAIQSGATEIAHLTRAQQGYGLMHAGNTFTQLQSNLEKLNSEEIDYFEVVINKYNQSYDRSKETTKVQSFELSLGLDGERPKSQLATVLANGVEIQLDRVEIVNHMGKVSKISDEKKLNFFHIVDLGDENNRRSKTHVTFNNSRTTGFHSFRNLTHLKEGHSYIAHYKIMYVGKNVGNILDVVHMPFKMQKSDIFVPNISLSKTKTDAGFARANQQLEVNSTHRYPIYVEEGQKSFDLNVALKAGTQGRLFVQVYNPKGKEVAFNVAQNMPMSDYKAFKETISTIHKGEVVKGIWEITISTPSSSWLSKASYDILVENNSFGIAQKEIEVKAGETLELGVNTSRTPLKNALMHSPHQAHLQKVEVKSHHVSYHPLARPDATKAVLVQLHGDNKHYWGRIDHSLYSKKEDGSFEKIKKVKAKKTAKGVLFSGVPTEGDIYYALDTIINFNLTPEDQEVHKTVDVLLVYSPDVEIKTTISAKKLDHDMTLLKVLVASKHELKPIEEDAKIYVVSSLVLSSNESRTVTTTDGRQIQTTSGDGPEQTIQTLIEF